MPGWRATGRFPAQSGARSSSPRTTSSGRCALVRSTPADLPGLADLVAKKQVIPMLPRAQQLAPRPLRRQELNPFHHPQPLLLVPPCQDRRHGEEHLIEQPLPNELPGDVRPRLAQQYIEPPLAKLNHDLTKVE